jgi:hypothetical protein
MTIATGNEPIALSGGLGGLKAPAGLAAGMPATKPSSRPRKRKTFMQTAYHNPNQAAAMHAPSVQQAYPAPYPQATPSTVS